LKAQQFRLQLLVIGFDSTISEDIKWSVFLSLVFAFLQDDDGQQKKMMDKFFTTRYEKILKRQKKQGKVKMP
jgi:hypothetical protein